MTKIVYSASFGGFSISKEAVIRGREITGDPKWGGVLEGEAYPDGTVCTRLGFNTYGRDISRTDPVLVQLITELDHAVNGSFANLRIADLPKGTKYRIDEYDGRESVMAVDDYKWKTA